MSSDTFCFTIVSCTGYCSQDYASFIVGVDSFALNVPPPITIIITNSV